MYSEAYMPDGTINYQVSKPYIEVNFRTPTDYNEISGLANPKVETIHNKTLFVKKIHGKIN